MYWFSDLWKIVRLRDRVPGVVSGSRENIMRMGDVVLLDRSNIEAFVGVAEYKTILYYIFSFDS